MNLNQFNTTAASDIPQTLELRDPFTQEVLMDEDGQPITLELYGLRSTAARNAHAARQRKIKKDPSPEEAARYGSEYLAAITAGWSSNLSLGEEPMAFNRQNAITLYLEQDWVASQALEFASELGNYDPKR